MRWGVRVEDRHTEELLKLAREADKKDRERMELFEIMVKTDAWKAYIEILNSKLQAESENLLEPAKGLDGCIGSEYIKGTMRGLILARDLPAAIIAAKPQLRPVRGDDEEVEFDDDAA